MRIPKSGLTYFALVFAAGFVLGAIRVPLLVPRLGERTAELIEMPIMFVAIVISARFVVRRLGASPSGGVLVSTGLIALALLVAAELLLAVVLQGQPLSEYIAGKDPVSGGVYLAMLLVYAAMPLIVGRRRGAGGVRQRPAAR